MSDKIEQGVKALAVRIQDQGYNAVERVLRESKLVELLRCSQDMRELWGRDTSQVCNEYDAALAEFLAGKE